MTIHTNAQLDQATGFIGDFRTTVRLKPRGVTGRVRQSAGGHRRLPRGVVWTNSTLA